MTTLKVCIELRKMINRYYHKEIKQNCYFDFQKESDTILLIRVKRFFKDPRKVPKEYIFDILVDPNKTIEDNAAVYLSTLQKVNDFRFIGTIEKNSGIQRRKNRASWYEMLDRYTKAFEKYREIELQNSYDEKFGFVKNLKSELKINGETCGT